MCIFIFHSELRHEAERRAGKRTPSCNHVGIAEGLNIPLSLGHANPSSSIVIGAGTVADTRGAALEGLEGIVSAEAGVVGTRIGGGGSGRHAGAVRIEQRTAATGARG